MYFKSSLNHINDIEDVPFKFIQKLMNFQAMQEICKHFFLNSLDRFNNIEDVPFKFDQNFVRLEISSHF